MKVVVYARGSEPTDSWLDAFTAGLQVHGVETIRSDFHHPVLSAQVAVMYGISQRHLIRAHQATGARCLIMEMGFVGDRLARQSLLWDGLNGYGTHPRATDGGERWREEFGTAIVKPWRVDGDYVLLIGQYPGDQSIKHFEIGEWYRRAATAARRAFAMPVHFRPHPEAARKGVKPPAMTGVTVLRGDLDAALKGAAVVVTANSNTGVLAAIAGVPVIATDRGAMCWPVASHTFTEPLVTPDRSQWLADLAWAQWSIEEMRSGAAWEHVRQSLAAPQLEETV